MKKPLLLASLLIFIPILAVIGWFGYSYYQRLTSPVFTFEQHLDESGQFMESSLSYQGGRYVSTRTEFSLVPDAGFHFEHIIGKQDAMIISTVAGKDDYVTYSGFMFSPVVYRKETTPPIDFATLPVSEIQYFGEESGRTVEKKTGDIAIIRELTQRLLELPASLPTKPDPPDQLRIFSPNMPKLYDYIYISIYPDQKVYLILPPAEETGILAGPLFSNWVLQR